MTLRFLRSLSAAASLALLLSLAPSAVQAEVAPSSSKATTESAKDRTTRIARANTLQRIDLNQFLALAAKGRAGTLKGIDAGFDWNNNGCSVPAVYPNNWRDAFAPACIRHDFGYRNFGHGWYRTEAKPHLALGIGNATKDYTDSVLATDMDTICETGYKPIARPTCHKWADTFYAFMQTDTAHEAWHDAECIPGRLCLFEDTTYRGNRYSFAEIQDDLDDGINFDNDASALKNRDDHIWVLYRSTKFNPAAGTLCIPPGKVIADLHKIGWGDAISSIAEKPGKTC